MTTLLPARLPERHGGCLHEAVFHAGVAALVDSVRPWVDEGLAADDPVVMLLTKRTSEAIRDGLGANARHVVFGDMGEAGRNPARIISLWRVVYDENHRPGHHLRAIGEPVWPGRSADELSECAHHEALLNRAFAHAPDLWLWCPYDTTLLAPEVLAEAERNHPWVVRDGRRQPSDHYDEEGCLAAALDSPLSEPEGSVSELVVEARTLRGLRRVVACQAAAAGLSPDRAGRLVLAISELATNSIKHGGGRGRLRSWISDDRVLVNEVSDKGYIEDPLVGRSRPTSAEAGGRGMWLINELCDLVQLRSTAHDGTVVRVHMHCS
ncbi:MAG TPA: sensor histidine kinase [Acidimicrobiales bacterium]|nr:sensor histidine kinase [Acidimicrobiales bacterium]